MQRLCTFPIIVSRVTRFLFGLSCHNSKFTAKIRITIESTKSADLFGLKFVSSKTILYFCTQN